LTEIALLEYAFKHKLPLTQVPKEGGISAYTLPTRFSDPTESNHNVLVTASFGHIIPNSFLGHFEVNKRLNVHPSLLPRYRGAAPIQWTIANGDTTTGVSVQRLIEKGRGIDGGDIVGIVDGIVSLPDQRI
jgi:methionyl-tRNA formyltransferase